MRALLVLGSTGSIGTQALDVVRASPGRFRIEALAAGRSWQALLEQAREFRPRLVAVTDPEAAAALRGELDPAIALVEGPQALEQVAAEADYDLAVHGVVGARGLLPSVRVLERGRALALANKESLVLAGAELMELARRSGAPLLPVDSELCAIHQCLRGERACDVRRVVLTASGGPFRDASPEELERATPEAALRHPNWSMGPRITVGSATLMNKALEVIEVHHLFGLAGEQIGVAIHRQSLVHSLVELVDGSVLAQMGPPDMRGPLHYCLHHPERAAAPLAGFDPARFAVLSFEEVDPERFPALELGYRCVAAGSDAGAVLNAADEVAVAAFLEGRIGFGDIVRVNAAVLERRPGLDGSVERLLEADRAARDLARVEIEALTAARTGSFAAAVERDPTGLSRP
jgi:1-deoxy-D-xylulose-5-phosphate reductoisomerase